ncbi:hypothetical protein MJT46_010432 [Ovis ammon polii x Ovis aries]|nr:hypothetical protein MJT46_010432 [Ovis ammon polii x Ovis aries]
MEKPLLLEMQIPAQSKMSCAYACLPHLRRVIPAGPTTVWWPDDLIHIFTVDRSRPANGEDTASIPGVGGLHKPRNSWAGVPNYRTRSRACELRLLKRLLRNEGSRHDRLGSLLTYSSGPTPRGTRPAGKHESLEPTHVSKPGENQKIVLPLV